MRHWFAVLAAGLLWTTAVQAQGLLVPTEKDLAPLAMVAHNVKIKIEDQAAVTHVTQTFRNPTSRQLEATYLFPVPKGAGVKKFTMWVDGKEVNGELVEADKARTIYTDVVRRLQDPGLLEYVGSNMLRLRIFPVPANGDQKVAVSFTSIANQENGLVEYCYPLKKDAKSSVPLEKFSLHATLRSQHLLQNVYSPSHSIKVERHGDHEAVVSCVGAEKVIDKDFQLYWTQGSKDVELTALTCRPARDENGTFMLLISPRAELSKKQHVARDMVFVLDTSGSMQGAKMAQAQKALKFCLGALAPHDRFTVMNFATTVNRFSAALVPAGSEQVERAKKWVDELSATGGTAIDGALDAALESRGDDHTRPYTVVFFTDGQPTVGETNPDKILAKVIERNTANTRIFTFGVGDDVNAALLDQLADKTRAVSTYVRPEEDIEVKTSGLFSKISHPVLTDLKLTAGKDVTLTEIYPVQLPDLFHGSQLVVLGRYHGKGHTNVTLTGSVGKEKREFVYEVKFPEKTDDEKSFVVDLWRGARSATCWSRSAATARRRSWSRRSSLWPRSTASPRRIRATSWCRTRHVRHPRRRCRLGPITGRTGSHGVWNLPGTARLRRWCRRAPPAPQHRWAASRRLTFHRGLGMGRRLDMVFLPLPITQTSRMERRLEVPTHRRCRQLPGPWRRQRLARPAARHR